CWSLFLELVANLLFVVCWPLLTSRLLAILCVLTGGVVAWVAVQNGNIDVGSTASGLSIGLARTLFGFCAGVLIARHMSRSRRQVSNLKVLAIVLVVGVAIAGWPTGRARVAWDAACVLLVFPLMVCWGTLIDPG